MEIVRTTERFQKPRSYACADLAEEFSGPVYKLCRSLTYSKEDAEDLFQQTFLHAFERIAKVNAAENPQSFLFSACVYIWKGWKRKYARRKRLAPVEPLDETAAICADIEDDYIAREEICLVRRLVDTLPEKLKIPTILYYTLEMSVPDIAQALKIPEGTVKSRLFKARKLVEKGLVDAQ